MSEEGYGGNRAEAWEDTEQVIGHLESMSNLKTRFEDIMEGVRSATKGVMSAPVNFGYHMFEGEYMSYVTTVETESQNLVDNIRNGVVELTLADDSSAEEYQGVNNQR
ncbi:hypothetical protein RIF23_18520 [Lipingzhangella sp. LS1_29]|uniref:Uncharacterized protein n=1 Tax=Lipingzhangella rawalii TaxID=2055835 RepID=A0ABU2HAE9_9ACTN|nr:hypothetical protein [Lipingzhangella rawalii]MDS1272288.1 hypothetical protein [Lipingzhangella rawalii]